MGGLLEDPEAALRTLRAGGIRSRPSSIAPRFTSSIAGSAGPASSAQREAEDRDRVSYGAIPENEPTIRVAAAAVDRLLDSVVTQDGVRESISSQGDRAREGARTARRLRGDLIDALRLIGPPRPWGAPAAALRRIEAAASQLTALADEHERAGTELRQADQSLRETAHSVSRELSTMRLTPIKRLFSRMASAVESEARRTDRAVAVRTLGADETVDRRLAEALVEPCLQLARNAAAHGIEPTAVREANGKPAVGTLTLSARRVGGRLVLTISDDGAGVDVAAVRERAIVSGQVTRALAQAADDNTLLALLFLPGFSTRDSSDLLAGRGIGLDLALASVQKLGGAIRLSSRQGEGFEARVEVPVESGLATVLWVRAGDLEIGLLAATTRKVSFNEGEGRVRVAHLAACLEPRPNAPARFCIELHLGEAARRRGDDATPVVVGVDEVGRMEDVLVRPLSPRLAALGPYAGVIVRGDGSVRFAIDPFALAPRARALGRVPDGRTSEFPGGPPALPSGSLPLDLLRDSSREPW
jgi:two-component system chemotaxis sensor kinase CheA